MRGQRELGIEKTIELNALQAAVSFWMLLAERDATLARVD